MTSVPRWEPDGTESPAERTDPLIPAITDDMAPPLGLPRPPTLDDRTLERMLAELEPDEPDEPEVDPAGAIPGQADAEPSSSSSVVSGPKIEPSPEVGPIPSHRMPDPSRELGPSRVFGTRDGAPAPAPEPAPVDHPLRLVEHPGGPADHWPTNSTTADTSKYVRRDARPPEVHADALSLTGLTRRSRSRVGSILFTVAFVGIFVLIVVQAIVSLLTPGG